MLEVLYKTNKKKYAKGSAVWLCKCDCGNTKELSSAELSHARSCGCIRQKNMETFGQRNKGKSPVCTLPLGESARRSLYAIYKKSAKKRNIPFSLFEPEFRTLISGNCHYCGSLPSQVHKDRHRANGDILYNGIDRTDNTVGYTTINCVPCCKICNRAKDTMTQADFFAWVKRVAGRLAS